ncbi:imidazole glycerol phosphate synthase subunit HisH [Flavobacteriaceae bacterium]|jgi:glutamine amidotransferase|nr:imidazole glycerol phosphate synthase subunit HisH [Flavobacteriaceae bacterium]
MIYVTIVDYDLGNQDSLYYSLKALGFKVKISKDIEILSKSDVLILPGVGSFPEAIKRLKENNLSEFLIEWSSKNKPIIGICLGMQLLCIKSYEYQESRGLGIINGEIIALNNTRPHIGWNNVFQVQESDFLYSKMNDFYFNHSFKFKGNKKLIIGNSTFNDENIPAIIKKNNVVGVQFHPEKSQKAGKKLLSLIIKKLVDG